jgi:hypothetical protein
LAIVIDRSSKLSSKTLKTYVKMPIWNRKSPEQNISTITPSPTPSTPPEKSLDPESAIHAETTPHQPPSQSKWKVSRSGDGDVAMSLFNSPSELHEPISPEEDARVKRKVDWMILPYLAVCYVFFYVDKTTLSYAAIFGIREDLHLVGKQYSWLSSIFYFGFLAWAFPTNFLMQRLPIGKYLGANICLWGVFLMIQAAAHNFAGLAALRAMAGAAEACADPSFMLITSMWYKVGRSRDRFDPQSATQANHIPSAPNSLEQWAHGTSPTASASRSAACSVSE